MKHLETLDSIILAAFIGGAALYIINQVNSVTDENATLIGYGAATGAAVQIVLRMIGAS